MNWQERQDRAKAFASECSANNSFALDKTPIKLLNNSSVQIWKDLAVEDALDTLQREVWMEGQLKSGEADKSCDLTSSPFFVIDVLSSEPGEKDSAETSSVEYPLITLKKHEATSRLSVVLAKGEYCSSPSLFLRLEGIFGEADPLGKASLTQLLEKYGLENGLKRALMPQSISREGLTYLDTIENKSTRNLVTTSTQDGNLSIETEILYPQLPRSEERFNAALVQMIDIQQGLNSLPAQLRARNEELIAQLPRRINEDPTVSAEVIWRWFQKRKNGEECSLPDRLIKSVQDLIQHHLPN